MSTARSEEYLLSLLNTVATAAIFWTAFKNEQIYQSTHKYSEAVLNYSETVYVYAQAVRDRDDEQVARKSLEMAKAAKHASDVAATLGRVCRISLKIWNWNITQKKDPIFNIPKIQFLTFQRKETKEWVWKDEPPKLSTQSRS